MGWSVAAVLVLAVGLAGLVRLQNERRTMTTDSSSLGPKDEESPPTRCQPPEQRPALKSCPACLAEYHPRNRYCVRDGAELSDRRSAGPFSQGMVCPTCRRGYPLDASFCPEDADELMPYGVFGAASSTRPPIRLDANKICPECGAHQAPTHLFCGDDGSELVVVN